VVTIIFFTECVVPGSQEEKIINSSSNVSQKYIRVIVGGGVVKIFLIKDN